MAAKSRPPWAQNSGGAPSSPHSYTARLDAVASTTLRRRSGRRAPGNVMPRRASAAAFTAGEDRGRCRTSPLSGPSTLRSAGGGEARMSRGVPVSHRRSACGGSCRWPRRGRRARAAGSSASKTTSQADDHARPVADNGTRPRPRPTTTKPPTEYIVQSGRLAVGHRQEFGTSVAALVAFNNIAEPGSDRGGSAAQDPAADHDDDTQHVAARRRDDSTHRRRRRHEEAVVVRATHACYERHCAPARWASVSVDDVVHDRASSKSFGV